MLRNIGNRAPRPVAAKRGAVLRSIGTKLLFVAIVLLLLGEGILRYLGVLDFPLYDVGGETQYVVRASQHGVFLNRNDWVFNNLSMPTDREWTASLHPNMLLIGNSVVMGGDPYRQNEKLSPQLESVFGRRLYVWPVATSGWTVLNEIAYLDAHPDLGANANYFSWEYMAGGLNRSSPWISDYIFPRRKPLCGICYAAGKYLLPLILRSLDFRGLPVDGPPSAEGLREFDREISRFHAVIHNRPAGMIWLYPSLHQLALERAGKEWLPERRQIYAIARKYNLRIVDVAKSPLWNTSLYRDDTHPNPAGNRVLAAILSPEIIRDLALK